MRDSASYLYGRRFPLLEAAILEAPQFPSYDRYLNCCADHPNAPLSEEMFRKYANEIDGLTLVKRIPMVTSAPDCQEDACLPKYVDTGHILHFFHEHSPELLEKVG